jgi:DNA polymerase III subunit beta
MIVSVLQDNLKNALKLVKKAIDNNPQLPVLANVLLETFEHEPYLRITGTNLETTIIHTIGAKVELPGSITLPAKTFSELVERLSNERMDLRLNPKTETVHIKCGVQKTQIKGITAEEYPPTPDDSKFKELFHDDTGQFVSIVAQSQNYALEQNRPILESLYIAGNPKGKVTLATADGYSLSKGSFDTDTIDFAITPIAKSIRSVLSGVGDKPITVSMTHDKVRLAFDNTVVYILMVEGRYPDFDSIIPQSHTTSILGYTKDIKNLVKRSMIFGRDNANSINLHVESVSQHMGQLTVVGKSAERGDTEGLVEIEFNGEPVDVSVNGRYLTQNLAGLGERVSIQFNGPQKAITLADSDDNDMLYVIMPMSR